MQWFKHDTSASLDSKIKKLIMKYDTRGYAIYWHCLELIAGGVTESNVTFELEHDSEIIADTLKVKSDKADQSAVELVQEIMRYMVSLGLFEESGGRITCFKLLKRLDSSMTSNPKMRAIIQEAKKSHDPVMIPSCCSHDTIMQEKNRTEKKEEKREEEKSTEEQDSACAEPFEYPNVKETLNADTFWSHWEKVPGTKKTGKLHFLTFSWHRICEHYRTLPAIPPDEIYAAIDNYAAVKALPETWWEANSPPESWICKSLARFMTEAFDLGEYKKDAPKDKRISEIERIMGEVERGER